VRHLLSIVVVGLSLLGPGAVHAYDLGTHARLSQAAVLRSALGTQYMARGLGFVQGMDQPLGTYFFDIGPDGLVVTRSASDFETSDSIMPLESHLTESRIDPNSAVNIRGWIMRGTMREDDGRPPLFGFNPADDPLGPINRFCNHFYDPKNNRKLTSRFCLGDDLTSAPAWAIGVSGPTATGAIGRPMSLSQGDSSRRNHFTLRDARESMWRALTLRSFKDSNGALRLNGNGQFATLPAPVNSTIAPDPFSSDPVKASRQQRDAYWATALYSLGTMLHLNQDMAQPQHTRHEIHPLLKRKEFERYIEARALSAVEPYYETSYNGYTVRVAVRPVAYTTQEFPAKIPRFQNLSDYWSTNVASGAIGQGLGLADFSNSRFFTLGHNLGNTAYSEPSNDPSIYQSRRDADLAGLKHTYLIGTVSDPLTGESRQVLMTRPTLLNELLSKTGFPMWALTSAGAKKPEFYTLDHAIYDQQADVLLPRAVAYSAGLIDWFFRGDIGISAPDEGVYALVDHSRESGVGTGGFSKIKLKLTDQSKQDAIGAGYLVGIVKFHRNSCYTPNLDSGKPGSDDEAANQCRSAEEEIVVSKPIQMAGLDTAAKPFTFEFPDKIPINAIDVYLQVVFRGQLGSESDAVVVSTKDLYEPSFIAYQNAHDYITFDSVLYTLADAEAVGLPFTIRVTPQSCLRQDTQGYTWCFGEDPLRVEFKLGSGSSTIVADKLPVREYIRMAFLAETQWTPVTSSGSCQYQEAEQRNLLAPKWQLDYDIGRRIIYRPRIYDIRGVRGHDVWSCFWRGDGSSPADKDWLQGLTPTTQLPPTPFTLVF
jgi:hypothetical protein